MKSVHDIHAPADAYADQGRWYEAVEAYKTALGLNPDSADLHNDLGIAYEEIGNTELAEQAYHKAIALRPNHSNAYFNLGSLYKEQDRLSEATSAFESCLQFTTDPDERSDASKGLQRVRRRAVRKSSDERLAERLDSLGGSGDLGWLLLPAVIRFALFPGLEAKLAMIPRKIEKRWVNGAGSTSYF